MNKNDPVKKAIDSIGKPKRRHALEAEEKFAKMTPDEKILRREEMKLKTKGGE